MFGRNRERKKREKELFNKFSALNKDERLKVVAAYFVAFVLTNYEQDVLNTSLQEACYVDLNKRLLDTYRETDAFFPDGINSSNNKAAHDLGNEMFKFSKLSPKYSLLTTMKKTAIEWHRVQVFRVVARITIELEADSPWYCQMMWKISEMFEINREHVPTLVGEIAAQKTRKEAIDRSCQSKTA